MLGTLPPTNWFQISEKIPSLLVIISHRQWNSGEDRTGEKGGGSQTSVTLAQVSLHLLLCANWGQGLHLWSLLLLCVPHTHVKCLNGQTMPIVTSIQLSKWRRSNIPNVGMTLFGNLVPLDRYQISQHHKCQAIFLTQVCCLLQSLLPLNLTVKQTSNIYAMKGELDWLHFWCQRQYHTRQILQNLSLFMSGPIRTFRHYQLQHKRNGKLHVDVS